MVLPATGAAPPRSATGGASSMNTVPATPGARRAYWRSGTPGTATTRCWKASKSMVCSALDAVSAAGSIFALTPASSSLRGSTGLASPLRSTAT